MLTLIWIVSISASVCLVGGMFGVYSWRRLDATYRLLSLFVLCSGTIETISLWQATHGRSNIAVGNLWELAIPLLLLNAMWHASKDCAAGLTWWAAQVGVAAWIGWFVILGDLHQPFRLFHLGMTVIVLASALGICPKRSLLKVAIILAFTSDLPVYSAYSLWLSRENMWAWQIRAIGWLVAYAMLGCTIAMEAFHGRQCDIPEILPDHRLDGVDSPG